MVTEPTQIPNQSAADDSNQPAVELIRAKLDKIYGDEPDAQEEAAEAEAVQKRSKHQQYMHELSISGKTLAEVQTAWHNYYVGLSDQEKHEVWQEFYANHGKVVPQVAQQAHAAPIRHQPTRPHQQQEETKLVPKPLIPPDSQAAQILSSAGDIKDQLLQKVNDRLNLTHKHKRQMKSLGFGLTMGALVSFIMLFGFFNERFIAPMITPSRNVTSTPIITDISAPAESLSPNPVIIIPKINIEIPVVYDEPSIDEAAVQRALERGVLHYPTTPNPGEQGNATFFGHSSSNIFNNGRYKFAFVLLNRLESGDTFMIQKDGKRYIYRVFEKRIVPPTDISVLNDRDRPTATLVTCDPPGLNVNRLIVVGEQISPDPGANIASTLPPQEQPAPAELPADAPTLWGRFWGWLSSSSN